MNRGGTTIEGTSPAIRILETFRVEICTLKIHIFKSSAIKDNTAEVSIGEIGVEDLCVVKIGFSQRCIAKVSQLDGAIR